MSLKGNISSAACDDAIIILITNKEETDRWIVYGNVLIWTFPMRK